MRLAWLVKFQDLTRILLVMIIVLVHCSCYSAAERKIHAVNLNAGFSSGLAPYIKNGKWGFIDFSGRPRIPAKYEEVKDFSCNLAPVCIDGRWGVVDSTGREVLEPRYDDIMNFSDGMAAVRQKGKFGFINSQCETVIEPVYEVAGVFRDGLAPVGIDGKYGYIDKGGKVRVDFAFTAPCSEFSEGLAAVRVPGSSAERPQKAEEDWAFIDATGRRVIEGIGALAVLPFSEGTSGVLFAETQKWGYINKLGKVVIPAKYDVAFPFSEGLATVYLDGDCMAIDVLGKVAFSANKAIGQENTTLWPYRNGLALVSRADGKCGYLGKDGGIAIPVNFTSGCYFREGLARVATSDEVGYIGKDGNFVWKGRLTSAKNEHDKLEGKDKGGNAKETPHP